MMLRFIENTKDSENIVLLNFQLTGFHLCLYDKYTGCLSSSVHDYNSLTLFAKETTNQSEFLLFLLYSAIITYSIYKISQKPSNVKTLRQIDFIFIWPYFKCFVSVNLNSCQLYLLNIPYAEHVLIEVSYQFHQQILGCFFQSKMNTLGFISGTDKQVYVLLTRQVTRIIDTEKVVVYSIFTCLYITPKLCIEKFKDTRKTFSNTLN